MMAEQKDTHSQQVLRSVAAEHRLDPNFPAETLRKIEYDLSQSQDAAFDLEEKALETEIENDSPYPEVRAAVSNTDEDLPVDTIRAWTIGLLLSAAGAFLNQFFILRQPSVTISPLCAQLIAYPLGMFWAYIVPRGYFNPGPFNIKEHALITIMANVSFGWAYATDIIATQKKFYNQDFGWAFGMLLCITTQVIGYGMAGATRRFLVYPASMIWPATLVNCALFQTLHQEEGYNKPTDGSMSRYKFFLIAFLVVFIYEWIPNYFVAALAYFSWVCWLAPNNLVANQLFGVNQGLGMGLLAFDWAQVVYANPSPLLAPWWSEVNVMVGFVTFYWIVTPAIYYTNSWSSGYLPIMDYHGYDNTGARYNVSKILNPDKTFNESLYQSYSPLYLPATFALSYFLSFTGLTAVLVHIYLFYKDDIVAHWKQSRVEDDDIHRRLMRKYPEVPDYWYYILFMIAFALALVTCLNWDTHLSWWALIISLLIPIVYIVPIGIIQAITNQQPGLNVITEFICGYIIPGKPIANTMFKTYGYISIFQALSFISDLKMGHYMKIPPRSLFWGQTIATVIGAIVNCATVLWQLSSFDRICQSDQPQHFTCAGTGTFFTASIVWGAIGPARIFGYGQIYYGALWGFFIGVFLPIPGWFLANRYPMSWFKYINWPVIIGGSGNTPPATGVNYTMWGIFGFVFQYLIRRRYFSWWAKYNYILSAALDTGTAFAIFIGFFALAYSDNAPNLTWVGNDFSGNPGTMNGNLDGNYNAINLVLGPNETHFGVDSWA